MMRNDSTSIISSLQMDYADSDEEESDSRNNSKSNLEEELPSGNIVPENLESEAVLEDTTAPVQVPVEVVQKLILEKETDSELSDKTETQSKEIDTVKKEPEVSPAELISDDEDGEHPQSHHRHHHKHHSSHSHKEDDLKQTVSEAVNTDSPSSQGSVKAGRKATRLVSYGPDEDLDEESSSEEEEGHEQSSANSPELGGTDTPMLACMTSDDIKIPPEPPGKCLYAVQKKIEDMYERMRREGFDLNRVIQSKKNFRNPSIYDKLIEYCHIDEKGTNFPPDIYDPHIWGKESFYDELDKAQRKDMERREKEKKERTKIEFKTGTKKPANFPPDGTMGPSDEKKRKSKWDAQPMGIQVSKLPSASQNPGVVNLTAIATGTKATVISAVGSLSKKAGSGK